MRSLLPKIHLLTYAKLSLTMKNLIKIFVFTVSVKKYYISSQNDSNIVHIQDFMFGVGRTKTFYPPYLSFWTCLSVIFVKMWVYLSIPFMFMIYAHNILNYYVSDEIMRMCRAW